LVAGSAVVWVVELAADWAAGLVALLVLPMVLLLAVVLVVG